MKYSLVQCTLDIEGQIIIYNINFYTKVKKELSFIIKKNINKTFYLYNIKIKNNILINAKEGTKESGKEVKILKLKLYNNYFNSVIFVEPKDINKYTIKNINEKNILERIYFNKIIFKELDLLSDNKFPIYMVMNNFKLEIENIFDLFKLIYSKEIILINKKEDIFNLKYNIYINDICFYFDKEIANLNLKYNIKKFNFKLKKINKNINKYLKNYIFKKIDDNNLNEKIIFLKNLEKNKNYYLSVFGCNINTEFENNFISLNNQTGIFKIKIINKKEFKLNNENYNISIIDNYNITAHKTLEEAKLFNQIKINRLFEIENKIKNILKD